MAGRRVHSGGGHLGVMRGQMRNLPRLLVNRRRRANADVRRPFGGGDALGRVVCRSHDQMKRISSRPALTGDPLVIEIGRVARRFESKRVPADVADDIAQDLVLECLTKIRAGKWTVRHADLESFVRGVVRRRVLDWLRRCARADERNAQHARELAVSRSAVSAHVVAAQQRGGRRCRP